MNAALEDDHFNLIYQETQYIPSARPYRASESCHQDHCEDFGLKHHLAKACTSTCATKQTHSQSLKFDSCLVDIHRSTAGKSILSKFLNHKFCLPIFSTTEVHLGQEDTKQMRTTKHVRDGKRVFSNTHEKCQYRQLRVLVFAMKNFLCVLTWNEMLTTEKKI